MEKEGLAASLCGVIVAQILLDLPAAAWNSPIKASSLSLEALIPIKMLIISKGVHFLIFLLVCYWPLSMNEGSESCISWIEERGDSLFPQHTHLSSLISIISHLVPALVGCFFYCHVHPSLILTAPPSTIHILPPPAHTTFSFFSFSRISSVPNCCVWPITWPIPLPWSSLLF